MTRKRDIKQILERESERFERERVKAGRRPVGRPRLPDAERGQVYSVRIPTERLEEMRAHSAKTGEPTTTMMRRWIVERLEHVEPERAVAREETMTYGAGDETATQHAAVYLEGLMLCWHRALDEIAARLMAPEVDGRDGLFLTDSVLFVVALMNLRRTVGELHSWTRAAAISDALGRFDGRVRKRDLKTIRDALHYLHAYGVGTGKTQSGDLERWNPRYHHDWVDAAGGEKENVRIEIADATVSVRDATQGVDELVTAVQTAMRSWRRSVR